jgi:hypothetical protein
MSFVFGISFHVLLYGLRLILYMSNIVVSEPYWLSLLEPFDVDLDEQFLFT